MDCARWVFPTVLLFRPFLFGEPRSASSTQHLEWFCRVSPAFQQFCHRGRSDHLPSLTALFNQRHRDMLGGHMKLTNEELDALLAKAAACASTRSTARVAATARPSGCAPRAWRAARRRITASPASWTRTRSARRSAVRATGANGIAARRISITRTA